VAKQQFFTEDELQRRLKVRNFTVLLVYVFVAFYFLVNGEALLSPYWEPSWTLVIIIYMVGVALFLLATDKIPMKYKEQETPITDSVIGGSLAFLGATILFIVVKDLGLYFTTVTSMPVGMIPANLIFQLVIVASSEEIIFRGAIFGFLYQQYGWFVAYFGSALIFALFHYSAYAGNLYATLVAFFMGLVFAYCVDRWNIGVVISLHFAYNSFVIGATALI